MWSKAHISCKPKEDGKVAEEMLPELEHMERHDEMSRYDDIHRSVLNEAFDGAMLWRA